MALGSTRKGISPKDGLSSVVSPPQKKYSINGFIILLLIIIIAGGLWYFLKENKNKSPDDIIADLADDQEVSTTVDSVSESGYQAVFLNNGQVYFGNLRGLENGYYRMDNVYYFKQPAQTKPEAPAQKSEVALTKLGTEIHGPQNYMKINKDQIVIIEDLRMDSEVVKAILKNTQVQ